MRIGNIRIDTMPVDICVAEPETNAEYGSAG